MLPNRKLTKEEVINCKHDPLIKKTFNKNELINKIKESLGRMKENETLQIILGKNLYTFKKTSKNRLQKVK
jgi:allophanate hydrolase subunit 2